MKKIAVLFVAFITLSSAFGLAENFQTQDLSEPLKNALKAFDEGDMERTLLILSPEAQKGYAPAQFFLGSLYLEGAGVPQDLSEAAEWFLKAADQGHVTAQLILAEMHLKGMGVNKDYEEAAKWYHLAANQGHAEGLNMLGLMYMEGLGTEKDYNEAAKLFLQAAEQGVAKAQLNLGGLYENGQGVSKDDAQAAKWYLKAAEQGEVYAQYNLALCYHNGRGVPQNNKEAIKWYRKAAEQGDIDAHFNLGYMYRMGEGATVDLDEAEKWYRLAAEKGNKKAEEVVGLILKQKEGLQFSDFDFNSSTDKLIQIYPKATIIESSPSSRLIQISDLKVQGITVNIVTVSEYNGCISDVTIDIPEKSNESMLGKLIYLFGDYNPQLSDTGGKFFFWRFSDAAIIFSGTGKGEVQIRPI